VALVLTADRPVDRDEGWPRPVIAEMVVDGLGHAHMLIRQGHGNYARVLPGASPRHGRMLLARADGSGWCA
jgi:hypothetical protein